jgi:hypothetical protein
MSRFIQTQNGSFIAGSEIVNVREIDRSISTVTTRNGEHHTVEESANYIVSMLEEKREVIPASPGYNAIRRIFSEEHSRWTYELCPIIGWLRHPQAIYDQDEKNIGYPNAVGSIPIVAGQVDNQYESNIVLPDGRVIEVIKMHANIQEWFASQGGEDGASIADGLGLIIKTHRKTLE